MTLIELQKILGERIEIANNLEINNEKRKIENEKSEVIAKLAKQMINNADIILRAYKLITENKSKNLTIKELIK